MNKKLLLWSFLVLGLGLLIFQGCSKSFEEGMTPFDKEEEFSETENQSELMSDGDLALARRAPLIENFTESPGGGCSGCKTKTLPTSQQKSIYVKLGTVNVKLVVLAQEALKVFYHEEPTPSGDPINVYDYANVIDYSVVYYPSWDPNTLGVIHSGNINHQAKDEVHYRANGEFFFSMWGNLNWDETGSFSWQYSIH